jgi:signal transduction histidine kinase
MAFPPLDRLRLRLTVWYVATFSVILIVLGIGLVVTIRRQFSEQLDDSLRDATSELVRAARIREIESVSARGQVMDAVDELHIPDRTLLLLDSLGQPIKPESASTWVQRAARRALRLGEYDAERETDDEGMVRLHAERFTLTGGTPLVAVAVASRAELEDRYASLIAAFASAAAFALILVAAGGWLLVRQSTKPAERTIEYMRRFMADAAHELRTPLTVLQSRAEIALQQSRDAPAYISALRGIESESQRLGKIVEDLLTLARADTGERPIERKRVYLDDLALDAASAAQAVGQSAGVNVAVEEFEETAVDGDAALLRQLLMILLDNAVKFTPPGGSVSVRVSAPGGQPSISVSDTGIGIDASQLPHVFERFYRGDPARSRDAAGTNGRSGAGLGLAIAQWIAEAHGASIVVASEVERGTKVTVTFPPSVSTVTPTTSNVRG